MKNWSLFAAAAVAAFIAAVAVVADSLNWGFAPAFARAGIQIWSVTYPLLPIIVVLAVGAIALSIWDEDGVFVVAAIALIVAIGFSISPLNRRGHDIAHTQINAAMTVTHDTPPAFEEREPFGLATNRLYRSVGATSGYEISKETVWRFEIDGTPQTCGVKIPTKNAWKSPVAGVICVSDTGAVTEGTFDNNNVPSWKVSAGDLRLAGVIDDIVPRGTFNPGDIYGYIDDTGPHMAVPVTKFKGGQARYTGWVATVVFDADGSPRLVTDPSAIPGPTVGESTADNIINQLEHRGRFMEYRSGRSSFDPASGTRNHALLTRVDGEGERLVTLLTAPGNSETIVALLEIDIDAVAPNGWPTSTLYVLDTRNEDNTSRSSVAELTDLVTQRYGVAMQIAQADLRVFEATPSTPDHISITVGTEQRVFARVEANTLTRSTCVYTPAGEEVRCDKPDASPLPIGALPALFSDDETQTQPSEPADQSALPPTSDLEALSTAELAALLRAVAAEIETR